MFAHVQFWDLRATKIPWNIYAAQVFLRTISSLCFLPNQHFSRRKQITLERSTITEVWDLKVLPKGKKKILLWGQFICQHLANSKRQITGCWERSHSPITQPPHSYRKAPTDTRLLSALALSSDCSDLQSHCPATLHIIWNIPPENTPIVSQKLTKGLMIKTSFGTYIKINKWLTNTQFIEIS